MTNYFLLFCSFLILAAFVRPAEDRHVGEDTRMGSDAVTSGTDISDKEIQAEEENPDHSIDELKVPQENESSKDLNSN